MGDAMNTTAPAKKRTLRDAKVGVEVMAMAGYGGARVMAVYRIVKREKDHNGDYLKLAPVPTKFNPRDTLSHFVPVKYASYAIKSGLWRFDVENLDRDTGLIKSRPMTEMEKVVQRTKDEAWERFTQSETYRSM